MSESVGKRLKKLRLAKGLSQRDLQSPGVSYAYISRIEAGARTPSVKALRKLAKKLGVSVEFLETGMTAPVEQACIDAELEYGSLNAGERIRIHGDADEAAYRAALETAKQLKRERDEREAARLRAQADELERRSK